MGGGWQRPKDNPLRLLPSGSDRVGERSVRTTPHKLIRYPVICAIFRGLARAGIGKLRVLKKVFLWDLLRLEKPASKA